MATVVQVDFPPPPVPDGAGCQACEGLGVTGQQYRMPTGQDRVLLLDVFCPTCGGCGSADHTGCSGIHPARLDEDPLGPWDEEDLDDDGLDEEARCPSCQGREWNPIQGFPPEGEQQGDGEVVVLRAPCGCTTPRARLTEET
jgi:hypothetical protein